jgi:transcriptional regulator with XRE-family HTH domain
MLELQLKAVQDTLCLARKNTNYTQKFIAGKIGKSQNVYSRIENGEGRFKMEHYVILKPILGLLELETIELPKFRVELETTPVEPGPSFQRKTSLLGIDWSKCRAIAPICWNS